MKKIIYNLICFNIIILLFACNNSEYDFTSLFPEEYHKGLLIKENGEQILTMSALHDTYSYPLIILKSGSNPDLKATGTLTIMNDEEMEAYNRQKDVEYCIIPPSAYSLEKTEVSFAAGETSKTTNITFNTKVVSQLSHDKIWVLPIQLRSKDTNVFKNTLILKVTSLLPTISFTNEEVEYNSSPTDFIYCMSLQLSNVTEELEAFTCNVKVPDNASELITEYENKTGKKVLLLNEGYLLGDNNDATFFFDKGSTLATMNITLDRKSLPAQTCILPLQINECSDNRLTLSDRIFYLLISNTVDRSGWKIYFCNTDMKNVDPNSGDGKGGIEAILDGDFFTYWHSAYNVPDYGNGSNGGYKGVLSKGEQYTFVIDFGKALKLSKVGIAQRVQPAGNNEENWYGWNQNVKTVNIKGAVDGATKLIPDMDNYSAYCGMWGTDDYKDLMPAKTMEQGTKYAQEGTLQWFNVEWNKENAYRYLRISITERHQSNNKTVSLSEVNVQLAE